MTSAFHANNSFRAGLPSFQTANMYKTKSRAAKSGSSASLGGLSGLNSYAGFAASRTTGTQTGAWGSRSTLPPDGASETKWLGCSIDVEEHVFGETWEQVDEVPGYYELKDGKPLTWMGIEPDLEFRFYHAAESTEENPVLVARGADRFGRVFEQKIDVNKVNPYNATRMEMEALTTCYGNGSMDISIPFLDFYENPNMDKRFDYISGLQAAISTSRRLGFAREARRYQKDVDFLLDFLKNHTAPDTAETNAANSKRNLELCTSAVRERFFSSIPNA